MATTLNHQAVEEIQPSILALKAHGFELVSTGGEGMMLWAEFRRQDAVIRLVKDRGFGVLTSTQR